MSLPQPIRRLKDWTRHIRRAHLTLPLQWRNRWSAAPVVVPEGPVISLTSYGRRVRSVHLALESVARGRILPSRLILWLDDAAILADLPVTLRRLQARGLEVRASRNFGPHTKYYPWVAAEGQADARPWVTIDDDTIYPRDWLAGLVQAHRRAPGLIHAWRARTLRLDGAALAPYLSWPLCRSDQPLRSTFFEGSSGVIYPAAFARTLAAAGEGFLAACPKADDIWLNLHAQRSGLLARQIGPRAVNYPFIPGTESMALYHTNTFRGGNDIQFAQTYTPADLAALAACLGTDAQAGSPPGG